MGCNSNSLTAINFPAGLASNYIIISTLPSYGNLYYSNDSVVTNKQYYITSDTLFKYKPSSCSDLDEFLDNFTYSITDNPANNYTCTVDVKPELTKTAGQDYNFIFEIKGCQSTAVDFSEVLSPNSMINIQALPLYGTLYNGNTPAKIEVNYKVDSLNYTTHNCPQKNVDIFSYNVVNGTDMVYTCTLDINTSETAQSNGFIIDGITNFVNGTISFANSVANFSNTTIGFWSLKVAAPIAGFISLLVYHKYADKCGLYNPTKKLVHSLVVCTYSEKEQNVVNTIE